MTEFTDNPTVLEDQKKPLWKISNNPGWAKRRLEILLDEGWSVKKVAEYIGCSTSTIYRWLNEVNRPCGAYGYRLVELYKDYIDYLYLKFRFQGYRRT